MLWAVTTVCGDDMALLPHWIRHYQGMGAKCVVMLATDGHGPVPHLPDMGDVTFALMPTAIAIGKFQHYPQIEMLWNLGMKPDDWVMVADLDEMYEFAAPINDIIGICESKNLPCVYGHFVDMVAADGSLATVKPPPPNADFIHMPLPDRANLRDQFPVETRFTEMVCGGGTQKVMLMRPDVTIYAGHHYGATKIGGARLHPDIPFGELGEYKVRHYKWNANLIPHLNSMRQFGLSGEGWGKSWMDQSQITLDYFASHGNKIDFNDPPGLLDMTRRFYGNPT